MHKTLRPATPNSTSFINKTSTTTKTTTTITTTAVTRAFASTCGGGPRRDAAKVAAAACFYCWEHLTNHFPTQCKQQHPRRSRCATGASRRVRVPPRLRRYGAAARRTRAAIPPARHRAPPTAEFGARCHARRAPADDAKNRTVVFYAILIL